MEWISKKATSMPSDQPLFSVRDRNQQMWSPMRRHSPPEGGQAAQVSMAGKVLVGLYKCSCPSGAKFKNLLVLMKRKIQTIPQYMVCGRV